MHRRSHRFHYVIFTIRFFREWRVQTMILSRGACRKLTIGPFGGIGDLPPGVPVDQAAAWINRSQQAPARRAASLLCPGFVHIKPIDAVAAVAQLLPDALVWRCVHQAWIPSERCGNGASIPQVDDDPI